MVSVVPPVYFNCLINVPCTNGNDTWSMPAIASWVARCQLDYIQANGQFVPVREQKDKAFDISLLQDVPVTGSRPSAINRRIFLLRVVVIRGLSPAVLSLRFTTNNSGRCFAAHVVHDSVLR